LQLIDESATTAQVSLGGAYFGLRISSAVLGRGYQAVLVSFWGFHLSITLSNKRRRRRRRRRREEEEEEEEEEKRREEKCEEKKKTSSSS
jgi:C4-dicarboxylate-specific signal transduction histidine kinase